MGPLPLQRQRFSKTSTSRGNIISFLNSFRGNTELFYIISITWYPFRLFTLQSILVEEWWSYCQFLTCDWSVVATSHFSLVENDKCSPNQTWLSDQVSLFGCFHLCLDAKIVDEVEKGLLVEPPFPVWIRDFAMTPPPSQKCFLTAFESFTFLIYTSFNGLKVKRICLQCLVSNVNLLNLHRKTLSIRLHR